MNSKCKSLSEVIRFGRICLFSVLLIWVQPVMAVEGDNPRNVARSIGLGWNLGNQLDAYREGVARETAWGNCPVTPEFFHILADAGFTSVRIPVTWMGHFGEAPGYRISSEYMKRVDEVVGYAEKAGLNVIINIHHDGADGRHWLNIKKAASDDKANREMKAKLVALWTQIAEHFKEKGNFLMFEAMNEIHDGKWGWGDNMKDGGKQYAVLNEWNQTFVNAVRATGGNNATRYLGVPGYVTNIGLTVEHFRMPEDKMPGRLAVSVHYYSPMDYTLVGKYSEWGHTANPAREDPGEDEEYMESQFKALKAAFIDRGIPAYIGEMTCIRRNDVRHEAFRLYYLEYLCKAARDNGMAVFYWDNGQDGTSLFDRAAGEFRPGAKKVVEAMRRAVFTDAPYYTLKWVYTHCAP